jgi:hypothetical protein
MLVRTVRPVHLAATFVDLTARGYLLIEVTDGAEPDWLITRVRPVPLLTRDEDLLRYERTLLRKVFRRGRQVRLSDFRQRRVRRAIRKVNGQMGRIPGIYGPATQDGHLAQDQSEAMVTVRAFRNFLREFEPEAETDRWAAFGDYLPYAIAFQLMPAWREQFARLMPPERPAADGYWYDEWGGSDATTGSGFVGFTTAVCSQSQFIGTHAHSGGSASGHPGASAAHHGGHGGHF